MQIFKLFYAYNNGITNVKSFSGLYAFLYNCIKYDKYLTAHVCLDVFNLFLFHHKYIDLFLSVYYYFFILYFTDNFAIIFIYF